MHLKCIKHEENQNVIRNSRILLGIISDILFINSERDSPKSLMSVC